jgi:hypothetical protein
LCALILFSSCKLAGFEKRRYRPGYFVQVRCEKNTSKKEEEIFQNKKTAEEKTALVIVKELPGDQEQNSSLVASTEAESKLSINKLLPLKTSFVIEHLKESKQNIQNERKLGYKKNDKRTSNRLLVVLVFLLIFIGVAALFKLLIPTLSWLVCFYISLSLMLLLFLLLFLGVKN